MKIAAATVAALGLAATPTKGAIDSACDICSGLGGLVTDRTFLVPDTPDVGYTAANQVEYTAGYTNTCGALSDAINDATIGPNLGATCEEVQENFFIICCAAEYTPCGMCSGGGYPTLPVPDTPVESFVNSQETCRSIGFAADQLTTDADIPNFFNLCWNYQYAAAVECGCASTPALPDNACSICGDDEVVDIPLADTTMPSEDEEGQAIETTMQCSAAQVSFNFAAISRVCGADQTGIIECSETQYCQIETETFSFNCVECPTTEDDCQGDELCSATCFRPDVCLTGQTFAENDCCLGVSPCEYCPAGVENPDKVVADPILSLETTTCGEIKSRYTDLAAATQLCTDIIAHAEAAGCVCNFDISNPTPPGSSPTTPPAPTASPTAEIKATIIISLAGVPNATMGSNDTGVFQDVFLEVLKEDLVSQDVFITDVVVTDQDLGTNAAGTRALTFEGDLDVEKAASSQGDSSHPRLLLEINRGRSLLSSSVLDVTTDIIGWYIPPPEKNLDELAEDSINANGDEILQDLRNASATDYFDPVTDVSARQLPSETPSSSPTKEPTTSAALWNVRVDIFSMAKIGLVCAVFQALLW